MAKAGALEKGYVKTVPKEWLAGYTASVSGFNENSRKTLNSFKADDDGFYGGSTFSHIALNQYVGKKIPRARLATVDEMEESGFLDQPDFIYDAGILLKEGYEMDTKNGPIAERLSQDFLLVAQRVLIHPSSLRLVESDNEYGLDLMFNGNLSNTKSSDLERFIQRRAGMGSAIVLNNNGSGLEYNAMTKNLSEVATSIRQSPLMFVPDQN